MNGMMKYGFRLLDPICGLDEISYGFSFIKEFL